VTAPARPDLEALRRAATAATPGPWIVTERVEDEFGLHASVINQEGDPSIEAHIIQVMEGEWDDDPNAAYLAVWHPQTALALLDYIFRLETEVRGFA
jgi:hypothetical protein